jgi:hypothetical protein
MQSTINFSHNYPKLWGQGKAKLIRIEVIDARTLTKELIEYDTKTSDGKYYQLPKDGKLLQLFFVGDKGIPFCTLRRHTISKWDYYNIAMVNNFIFHIEIGA